MQQHMMARRAATALLPQWSSRVFSVEQDGRSPCFFSVRRDTPPGGHAPPELFSSGRCYSLLVCSADRIRAARYHAELRAKLTGLLPPECSVSPMTSFLTAARDSVVKGYFLKDPAESPQTAERLLRDLARHEPVLVCSYSKRACGQVWTQHLWWSPEGGATGSPQEFHVVGCDELEGHQSLLGEVFLSFEEARDVMRQVRPAVSEIMAVRSKL